MPLIDDSLAAHAASAVWSPNINPGSQYEVHYEAPHTYLLPVQLGMGKERLLRLFHPDALDLLNTTNDLARVCADLADPSTHIMRKVTALMLILCM